MDNQADSRIAQLENEVRELKAQLKHEQEKCSDLLIKDELIQAFNRLPEGTLYRTVRDMKTDGVLRFCYTGDTWEEILGVTPEDSLADSWNVFSCVEQNDRERLIQTINKSLDPLTNFKIEVRYHHSKKKGQDYWIQISSYPRHEGDFVYAEGFIFDITAQKKAEKDLLAEKERLHALNTELQTTSEELTATNEELSSTNEEFAAITDELHKTNAELELYRTQLETMVESKTAELVISQENLLMLSHRQALFIKVLQIIQLEDDLPKAMNAALAEIGAYTGVSRMQVWENNSDGFTYGVSYEWCNEGVEPSIHYLKTIPLEYGKPWFDMLLADRMICTSDISTLHPDMIEILQPQGVKSIVVLPLAEYGVFFGYIAFTVTEVRVWEKEDVELLKNIAQIVSTASKRHQAEMVIQQSQQVMRTVLDNINANIFVTDYESSKILFANKSFKQETGEDVEGKICWQALKAGNTCACEHCPKSILFDNNRRPIEGVHLWEDYNPFSKRWYTIASTAIEWVDGRMAIMELATDITDRKLSEMELVRAREKAEESDKLKSAFLANMSHEIRTPVNGITGFLHFLKDDDLSPKRRKEYIKVINNSTTQLVKLIDDIIDVAKIEAKQMRINPVPVQVNALMEDLQLFFDTYTHTINKGHISLILDDSEFIENCTTYVDAIRLRQVLTNLISNAFKFTEKGYIRFAYRQLSPDKLEFLVEDTGIGMKPEHCEVIFERFRQVGLTSNRLYGGTGLGLNISRNLVEMMGGNLWAESVEGEGSTFRFTISYLPVTTENEHLFKPQTDETDETKSSESRVALIVEPEIMKFKYIENILASIGFTAQQAINLPQGMDFYSKLNNIDVMMIDAAVFAQTSDDEIKKIKFLRPGLTLIVIGNQQNNNDIQASAILEEPVNYEELLRVIK